MAAHQWLNYGMKYSFVLPRGRHLQTLANMTSLLRRRSHWLSSFYIGRIRHSSGTFNAIIIIREARMSQRSSGCAPLVNDRVLFDN